MRADSRWILKINLQKKLLEMWISLANIIMCVNTTNYFAVNERDTKCLGVSIELLKCWQARNFLCDNFFTFCTRLNARFLIEINAVLFWTCGQFSTWINHIFNLLPIDRQFPRLFSRKFFLFRMRCNRN